MHWPTINEIRMFTPLPAGYIWDFLRQDEIDIAVDFFKSWFPSISVGMGSSFLDRAFYNEKVMGADRSATPILALVVRYGDEVVAIATWEKVDGADVISGRVGAVAKPHRQSNLAVAAQDLGEKMGIRMGAGLIYGMATTRTPYMQQALERAGYTAVGIMPGFDREEIEPGTFLRIYEVIYTKQLSPAEDFLMPSKQNFTPAVARLYAEIFKDGAVHLGAH
ncbi:MULTISPECIES: hypothetical protein [unclassified Pseudomonas]|uniref:hypothetical protein n=1 Tax=unclassified Pseudomonas TaxID=196821 RepID=UPI000D39FF1B|nr:MULTISPECIES: hypothetical protein [unclassified Pseudomonas]RAU47994.1 hypothetical protein DBP26_005510 [Pseudomonas sp. RIT 409]RAU55312.1 hypothetical protein DBY65_005155 [Pseudomonas sp. RIT 412]